MIPDTYDLIPDHYRRICGLHTDEEGDYAAVWLVMDPSSGRIRVNDCAVWREGEMSVIVAEALHARGRWIPIAWDNEALATELKRKHRCMMLPEKALDTDDAVDLAFRALQERMRTRLFTVDGHCSEWLTEFKRFTEFGSKRIPGGFPLMSATRVAMQNLERSRAKGPREAAPTKNYPKLAIV